MMMIDDEEEEQVKAAKRVCSMFRKMIDCERSAWLADYFIFYRMVSKEYVLYEFNTLMLACFYHDEDHYVDGVKSCFTPEQEDEEGGPICTHSLDDSRQTISFIEISIEAGIVPGILLGGKHEACFVLGVAGIEPMPS
jgi:hypothetical protein